MRNVVLWSMPYRLLLRIVHYRGQNGREWYLGYCNKKWSRNFVGKELRRTRGRRQDNINMNIKEIFFFKYQRRSIMAGFRFSRVKTSCCFNTDIYFLHVIITAVIVIIVIVFSIGDVIQILLSNTNLLRVDGVYF